MLVRSLSKARLKVPLPSRSHMSSSAQKVHFGPFEVTSQVFYRTPLAYALVNLKPLLPGHVLVVPFRKVERVTDLSVEEVGEVFGLVQKVQRMLGKVYFEGEKVEGGSFNLAIQDGVDAGQTVPHVHCHVIPRLRLKEGEKGEGDGFYDRLQGEEGNVGGGLWDLNHRPTQRGKFPKIEDEDRRVRSGEEMSKEAAFYKEQMALLD